MDVFIRLFILESLCDAKIGIIQYWNDLILEEDTQNFRVKELNPGTSPARSCLKSQKSPQSALLWVLIGTSNWITLNLVLVTSQVASSLRSSQ
jgi:hypothetical protein